MRQWIIGLAVVVVLVGEAEASIVVDSQMNGLFGFSSPSSGSDKDMATGITLDTGQAVQILASGITNLGDGLPDNGPDGITVLRPRVNGYSPLEEKLVDSGTPVGNLPAEIQNLGALVGAFVPKAIVETPGFLPRDDDSTSVGIASSQLFLIGSTYSFTAPEPGTLFLGINEPYVDNNRGSFNVDVNAVTEILALDIKPGSWPNSVNPNSKGVLPVAVPGTETFDVTEIDPATVMLSIEGDDDTLSPLRWAYEDVATPFFGEPGEGHDLDGDGFDDLTLKFNMQQLVEAFGLGDLTDEMVALTIYGELTDGTAFEGIDWIRMPGNANGNALQWQSLSDQPAVSVTAVPEPTTLALLCMGAFGFLLRIRRRR